jgi:glycosyltransferase involved in cell wall biosynthesis
MTDCAFSDLQIVAYSPDASACGYYRIIIPFTYLHKYNICKKVSIYKSGDISRLSDYDIIVAQRETRPTMAEDLQKLQDLGKTIILDTDDMLESVHPSNPAYRVYNPGSDRLMTYLKCINIADGLTVTTKELKDNYRKSNKNIHIFPNYLDYEFRKWPQFKTYQRDVVRIGWAGSSSHKQDIEIVGPALHEVLRQHDNVVYVHFSDRNLFNHIVSNFDLPENKCVFVQPVPFEHYPEKLENFDIGLCPIVNSKFNQAKSCLKPLEYSACGIPFIASDVMPYTRYTEQGKDGFLARTTNDWITYMNLLIKDMGLSREMAKYAYEKAKQYDIKDHLNELVQIWCDIAEGKQQTNVDPKFVTDIKKIKVGRNDPCPCGSGLKSKKCSCYPLYC